MRIVAFNQVDLPVALPLFYLLLPTDRGLSTVKRVPRTQTEPINPITRSVNHAKGVYSAAFFLP